MKQKIVRILNHYRRGREYVSLIQSILIGVIFFEQFDINRIHYSWIIPMTIIGFIFIGFIEKQYGFFKETKRYLNSQDPNITNINNKINKLYEIILETKETKKRSSDTD